MSKQRRTVTLDDDVDEYLDAEGVNASALVNKLVKQYQSAGGDDIKMLQLREQQLESEIGELQSRVRTKQDELDQIRERLDSYRDDLDDIVAEAADRIPPHARDPDNPGVENWANKAGVTPEELLDRIEDLSGGGNVDE